jgi:hypothetical protein
MIHKKSSSRALALVAPVVAVVAVVGLGGVVGYSTLHATAGTRTAPTATRGTVTVVAPAQSVAPAAVTGSWVYRDALTYELLRLKVNAKGVVSGDGTSTVKSTKDPHQTGQFTISVHNGRLRGNVLTVSLYVQQQFDNYLTVDEDLRCTPTTRALRCGMSLPLYRNVRNVPQNFYRRQAS